MNIIDEINNERPILIAGPTASGKSSLALKLATRLGGVIINADALQVYQNWRILTARPTVQDETVVPHRLYGHVDRLQSYSVGHWLRQVQDLLHANNEDRIPIIVGGTGLYFTALTTGLADIPEIPAHVRKQSTDLLRTRGVLALCDDLATHDPKTLQRIDQQNPVRVQRAWEVRTAFGQGLAAWQDDTPPPVLPLADCNAFVLDAPKHWLDPRIANRFSNMISDGCLEECRANLNDWTPDLPSSRAIGAPELMAHLKGDLGLPDAVELATIATRQYAKRQRSWFRAKMKHWQWVKLSTE